MGKAFMCSLTSGIRYGIRSTDLFSYRLEIMLLDVSLDSCERKEIRMSLRSLTKVIPQGCPSFEAEEGGLDMTPLRLKRIGTTIASTYNTSYTVPYPADINLTVKRSPIIAFHTKIHSSHR